MEAVERFALADQVGKRHCLGNGGTGNLSIPFIRDFIPCHASLNLFQDNPSHDARPFVGRLAMTNLQVGHNVAAQFDALDFAILFHSTSKMLP
jgi:hypothetical protein